MNDSYEMRVIEYESARNEAITKWFAARGDIEPNAKNERIFEGGFRMAWESPRSPGCYPETAWPVKFRLPDGRRTTSFFETKADAETAKRLLAYFDIDLEVCEMISG